MTVLDLDRNDVDAAIELYEKELLAGRWTSDDSEVIIMLQDDPSELMDRLEELNDRPDIARALDKLA